MQGEITAEEAVRKDKGLWRMARCFGDLKSMLRTRPVFHRTDADIQGHVFCSFLALRLKTELEKQLQAAGIGARRASAWWCKRGPWGMWRTLGAVWEPACRRRSGWNRIGGPEKGIEQYEALLASPKQRSANPRFAQSTNPYLAATFDLKLSNTAMVAAPFVLVDSYGILYE